MLLSANGSDARHRHKHAALAARSAEFVLEVISGDAKAGVAMQRLPVEL